MNSLHNALRSIMLPLSEIDKATPKKGIIIELGCGEGVISKFISMQNTRKVIGIDFNQERLPKKNSNNLKFIKADITKYNFPKVNAVIVSDVLHHINYKSQNKVLDTVYKSLKKGGVLIIKEIDTGEYIRSKMSRFWDFLFYPKERIYFNNALKLSNYLHSIGFKVSTKRPCRLFPGSTTLFICKKT